MPLACIGLLTVVYFHDEWEKATNNWAACFWKGSRVKTAV